MQTSRRGFLRGLAGLSATALAVKLNLPSTAMAEEVREELLSDLHKDRIMVSVPSKAFDPAPVWASVAGTADYWAKEIRREYAAQKGREIPRQTDIQLERMARELARRIDKDLMDAMVPKEKQLLIGLPKWTETRWGGLEISAGLDKRKTLFGEELRVEYIRPTELVAPDGSKLSMDMKLDDRGMAEYGGLILSS